MKTANAYKMIEKAGSQLVKDPRYHNGLIARFGYYNIELSAQDGEIIIVKVAPANERPDPTTDFHPGTYFPNLTRAIQYVLPRRVDGNLRPVPPAAPAPEPPARTYPNRFLLGLE